MSALETLGPSPEALADPREAHVWLVGPAVSDGARRALRATLSPAEQRQADRFAFDRDRRAYEIAHGALRQVLGRYLGCAPSELEFETARGGKPRVRRGGGLQWNLSHSGGHALIGVRRGAPLGVDIEAIRPLEDMAALARHSFAPAEVAALGALPAEQRLEGFFNCWTRKEAYIKATGEGLACALDRFTVTLAPGSQARIASIDGSHEAAAGWALHAFNPAPGMVAAVAGPGEIHTLTYGWCLEPRRMHVGV